ncbi:MAG TPA: DUF4112 domain-containing protein [Vicinamibacterales bacterium]|nr:DUF4112 domain-containing protein [Vicinamibacterales bacterium]
MRPASDTLAWLRGLAELLDNRFVIPGTSIRFGLDPVLALVPGVGTLVSPMFAVLLLVQGVHQHVPAVVLARMLANAFIDALIGTVPVAGHIGDIFWRANVRNLDLLVRHARPGAVPDRSDFLVAAAMAGLFGLVLIIPVVLALWFLASLWWVASGAA